MRPCPLSYITASRQGEVPIGVLRLPRWEVGVRGKGRTVDQAVVRPILAHGHPRSIVERRVILGRELDWLRKFSHVDVIFDPSESHVHPGVRMVRRLWIGQLLELCFGK